MGAEITSLRHMRNVPHDHDAGLWFETPPVDAIKKCLVCGHPKTWGIWDNDTGASVCVDCRDKARGPLTFAPATAFLTTPPVVT